MAVVNLYDGPVETQGEVAGDWVAITPSSLYVIQASGYGSTSFSVQLSLDGVTPVPIYPNSKAITVLTDNRNQFALSMWSITGFPAMYARFYMSGGTPGAHNKTDILAY
jgi:hypothetical protein